MHTQVIPVDNNWIYFSVLKDYCGVLWLYIGMTLLSLLSIPNSSLMIMQDVLDKSTVASSGELW